MTFKKIHSKRATEPLQPAMDNSVYAAQRYID